jgi:hypothetical protein
VECATAYVTKVIKSYGEDVHGFFTGTRTQMETQKDGKMGEQRQTFLSAQYSQTGSQI